MMSDKPSPLKSPVWMTAQETLVLKDALATVKYDLYPYLRLWPEFILKRWAPCPRPIDCKAKTLPYSNRAAFRGPLLVISGSLSL